MCVLHRGSPCLTWPALRSTSCWGNWASSRRPNLRTRCQRSSASLLPKTARLKTSRRTNPPLPLLPQRTPPQSPKQKSSTLTYNPSRGEQSRNLTLPHSCSTTGWLLRLITKMLVFSKWGQQIMDQPLSKDTILASAEGLLKVWICTYHSCRLLIFAAIITQRAALWVQKLEYVCSILSFGPSCVGCLQDSHLTWVFIVSNCFLPTVKLNEASGWKLSDWSEVDATCSGGLDWHTRGFKCKCFKRK